MQGSGFSTSPPGLYIISAVLIDCSLIFASWCISLIILATEIEIVKRKIQ